MAEGWAFWTGSALLGVGLAMDAFTVSLADGLREPEMSRRRMCAAAGVFAAFQALMPVAGWILVHTAAEQFQAFRRLIPWIGSGLLFWIGGRMLRDRSGTAAGGAGPALSPAALLIQGAATSVDALAAGFALASCDAARALAAAGVISGVTFCVCLTGLAAGRRAGAYLSGGAGILGGWILLFIGGEMLLRALA